MQSSAKTVEEYLAQMPEKRREEAQKVRNVLLKYLPKGYRETMNWGMICYEIPLETFADTYNKKPLMYAALANQKNHLSLYLCGMYCLPKLREQFEEAIKNSEKKLNMGRSCIRFTKAEDLPLEKVGEIIASVSTEEYIAVEKKVHKKK